MCNRRKINKENCIYIFLDNSLKIWHNVVSTINTWIYHIKKITKKSHIIILYLLVSVNIICNLINHEIYLHIHFSFLKLSMHFLRKKENENQFSCFWFSWWEIMNGNIEQKKRILVSWLDSMYVPLSLSFLLKNLRPTFTLR